MFKYFELFVKNPKFIIGAYVFLASTTGFGGYFSQAEMSEHEATKKQIAEIAKYYKENSTPIVKKVECGQCMSEIKKLKVFHY